jgi:hypothetical protein
MKINYSKIFIIIVFVVIFIAVSYFAVFGRALNQDENHIGIIFALPQLVFNSAVRIDNEKYLAKDAPSFIKAMEQEGFTFVEQMGSGYFFQKGGDRYLSTSRMYSSHFMVFINLKKVGAINM